MTNITNTPRRFNLPFPVLQHERKNRRHGPIMQTRSLSNTKAGKPGLVLLIFALLAAASLPLQGRRLFIILSTTATPP